VARVTATFDDIAHAEGAVTDLRRMGVRDTDFSFIARNDRGGVTSGTGEEADNMGERVTKGAVAGAGAGLLFGLAALAIPGVGPFITAGGIASALGATGGALASGAIVGGTSGAIAGALAKAGYERDEAEDYGRAIEQGGVLVAVDSGTADTEQVRSVLAQHGGQTRH
jgi:hypothetical protein